MTEDRIFEPGQMRMGPERQMQRDEPQTQQEMLMQANYADGVQCPNCGTINEPEAQFCASCGQPLRMAMCPNCGSEIDPMPTSAKCVTTIFVRTSARSVVQR